MRRRGFQTLTAVQEAVLASHLGARDLQISSQTGSGKTVALGLALAPELLESPAAGRGPSALVVVPTRELAAQIQEELGWLFADVSGVTIDCVTGGTSTWQERSRLARRPRVLVGTPGRLLDHLTSGALDGSDAQYRGAEPLFERKDREKPTRHAGEEEPHYEHRPRDREEQRDRDRHLPLRRQPTEQCGHRPAEDRLDDRADLLADEAEQNRDDCHAWKTARAVPAAAVSSASSR
jgi:hypothetical protein